MAKLITGATGIELGSSAFHSSVLSTTLRTTLSHPPMQPGELGDQVDP